MVDLLEALARKREVFKKDSLALDDCFRRVRRDSAAAEEGLKEIKGKVLSKVLADFSLGRITKGEVAKVKKRLRDLGEVVADHPVLLNGLMAERSRLDAEARQVTFLEQDIRKFLSLLKGGDFRKGMETDLLILARDLSKTFGDQVLEDAEEFLKQQQQASKQP